MPHTKPLARISQISIQLGASLLLQNDLEFKRIRDIVTPKAMICGMLLGGAVMKLNYKMKISKRNEIHKLIYKIII